MKQLTELWETVNAVITMLKSFTVAESIATGELLAHGAIATKLALPYANITANSQKTDIITAGWKLDSIIIKNNGAATVTLNIGTSDGGTQVMIQEDIATGVLLNYSVGDIFSLSAATSLWFHALDWTNIDLEVYVLIERVK